MKIHNDKAIKNLVLVSINLQGAECLLSFDIWCTPPLGTMWIDYARLIPSKEFADLKLHSVGSGKCDLF